MKRLILAFIATLLFCTIAFAGFYDGAKLVGKWREYQKQEAGRPYNYVELGSYLGYVQGVADTLNGVVISLPTNATAGQISAIVGKYLDDNPSEWSQSAHILVIRALKQAFPKK
jgi:hypothetical protein